MVATPQPEDWGAQLDALKRRIDEMERKTLYSASIGSGGLTVRGGFIRLVDDAGVERVYIGPSTFAQPPGVTQPVFQVRDASGAVRFGVYDAEPGATYEPTVWVFDDSNHVAFTTDQQGGIAEPWLNVAMYPRFIPTNFTNSTGTTWTLPASSCNGDIIWDGRIGKVSHPRIQFDVITGRVTGTNAVPTYTFWVNGVQEGSFSGTGHGGNIVGPFDISNLLGQTNIPVHVKVSATGTGTDLIACGMTGVHLRQS